MKGELRVVHSALPRPHGRLPGFGGPSDRSPMAGAAKPPSFGFPCFIPPSSLTLVFRAHCAEFRQRVCSLLEAFLSL